MSHEWQLVPEPLCLGWGPLPLRTTTVPGMGTITTDRTPVPGLGTITTEDDHCAWDGDHHH